MPLLQVYAITEIGTKYELSVILNYYAFQWHNCLESPSNLQTRYQQLGNVDIFNEQCVFKK